MKRCGKTFLCLAGALVLTPVVRAAINDSAPAAAPQAEASSEQPYSAIWVRNVFDLKPPAPPPTNAPPPTPPSTVHLMGITTFGNTRAILSVSGAGAPNQAKKDETFSMLAGERHGGVEVLEIDPKARTVKIKNDELVSTITFETNKPSAAAPAMAGAAHPPGFGQPPAYTPPAMPAAPGYGGNTPSPLRPMRTTDYSQGAQSGYSPAGYQPTSVGGYAATGYSGTGTAAAGLNLGNMFNQPHSIQNEPQDIETPPEITAAKILLQKTQADNRGVAFPPMPPNMDVSELQNPEPATGNQTQAAPSGLSLRDRFSRGTGSLAMPPAIPGR